MKLHRENSGTQGRGRTSIAVLGSFALPKPMTMHMVFQRRGAHGTKKGTHVRIWYAGWIRGGGGIEAANQLEDITLTMRRWSLTRLGQWERGETEDKTLVRTSSCPGWYCSQWVLSGSNAWLARPQGWSSIISSCKHHSYSSLVNGCLPWALVFLLLLY